MRRTTLRNAVVVASALFAFYLPSSAHGVISRELTIVSLLGVCGLLIFLALGRRGLGPPLLVLNSVAMLGWLVFCSLLSPFAEYSPGVVFIYLAVAVLYALNLRDFGAAALTRRLFVVVSVVSILMGFLIVEDVKAVDNFLKVHYLAFWPGLLWSMLDVDNKPVLTFATHSMAAFMIYLLFFMALRTFSVRGGLGWLATAFGYAALLALLQSTSGALFFGVAVMQLAALAARRYPWTTTPLVIVFVAAGLIGVLWSGVTFASVAETARSALMGDKIHGLISRYASEGLLAANFGYITEHPARPIGFGFSTTLYLGDSGLVVNLLRGSIPLLIMVYGGLYLFLRTNLRSATAAAWLWVVTLLFEIGFTPLQYFRFVGFVPFLVVYLNSLSPRSGPTNRADVDVRQDLGGSKDPPYGL